MDKTGFDLVPRGWFARWPHEGCLWWFHHFVGLVFTAGFLTLGAPFWFNLLKNLMSLRPAVASLVEKRPTSAPALPPLRLVRPRRAKPLKYYAEEKETDDKRKKEIWRGQTCNRRARSGQRAGSNRSGTFRTVPQAVYV